MEVYILIDCTEEYSTIGVYSSKDDLESGINSMRSRQKTIGVQPHDYYIAERWQVDGKYMDTIIYDVQEAE